MRSSHDLDRVRVIFDDDHAVANAGLILPATLAAHLGIEKLADETIDLGDRPGAARPGRKLMTLVHSIVAGATRSTTPECCGAGRPPRCSGTG